MEKNDNYFIFTSNIDGQFQKAGFHPSKIFEAHGTFILCPSLVDFRGSLCNFQCVNVKCREVWEATTFPIVDENIKAHGILFFCMPCFIFLPSGPLPLCHNCNSLARPNVSMFGDTTDTWKNQKAAGQKRRFLQWLKANKIEFEPSVEFENLSVSDDEIEQDAKGNFFDDYSNFSHSQLLNPLKATTLQRTPPQTRKTLYCS